MIDLTESSGLQVKFDESKGDFYYQDGINFERRYSVPLSEISPILLNKSLKYPEIVYSCSSNICNGYPSASDIIYDLLYVPSGLLGIEYVKTHVYYSDCAVGKVDCVIEVLYGELTIVMQKNCEKDDSYDYEQNTVVDKIYVISLYKGNRLIIPAGFMYTFINTGNTSLVIAKVSTRSWKPLDYSLIRKERGLACFVISKNAKVEAVANPKYKLPNKLKVMSYRKFLQSISEMQEDGLEELYQKLNKDPIYKQQKAFEKVFA